MTFKELYDSLLDSFGGVTPEFVRRQYNLFVKELGLSKPTVEKVSITFATNPYTIPLNYMAIKEISGLTKVDSYDCVTSGSSTYFIREDRTIYFSSLPTTAVDCIVYNFPTELANSLSATPITIPDGFIPACIDFIEAKYHKSRQSYVLEDRLMRSSNVKMRQAMAVESMGGMNYYKNLGYPTTA